MRRFGFSLGLAALFFCFVQTAKAEETSIFVKNIEGAGENRQKALADAFQNAVRKAVGTYTLSSSYDDGDTLDEKIFLNADAVVKSHNVVASEATPDGFMIVIDAEIRVPDQPMPIVRAVPVDFSQELVSDLWNRLVGDKEMYIQQSGETKQSIAEEIRFWTGVLDGTIVKDMYSPDEAREKLPKLQERYRNAPDAGPLQRADGTLTVEAMEDENGNVVAHRTVLDAQESNYGAVFNVQNSYDNKETIRQTDGAITVLKNASLRYSSGEGRTDYQLDWKGLYKTFWLKASDPIPEEAKQYVQMTPGEIQERADALLAKMGLNGQFAVFEIVLFPFINDLTDELVGYQYHVYCTRLVNGVPVCKSQDVEMNLYQLESLVAPQWIYECFEIGFDEAGNESAFWWSPIETQEVIEPNCRLQPFSEIQSVMESRLPMLLERRASNATVKTCTVNIYRIDLGLWRIREKNTVEMGLLVPVYCFYMEIRYQDEDENEIWTERTTDTLIINAVDGTLIDPWNGY